MKQSRTTWKKCAVYLGIIPALVLFVAFHLGPSIATAVFSFTNISGLPNIPWKFIGLENYREFFLQQNYRDLFDVLKRTLVFAASVTVFQNAVALVIAIALNGKFLKGRGFFRAVVFLPTVLGVMVTALCWNIFFGMDGIASQILARFGTYSAFFADRKSAFSLVIFVQCWMAMGYSMVIFLAGLQNISQDLYEAGAIDGCNPLKAFFYITFPLLWPTVTVNVILALIGSLSTFQVILFTTGGGYNTSTLPMEIYSSAFGLGDIGGHVETIGLRQGYAAAQAMVMFVIILIVTLVFYRWMNRKGGKSI